MLDTIDGQEGDVCLLSAAATTVDSSPSMRLRLSTQKPSADFFRGPGAVPLPNSGDDCCPLYRPHPGPGWLTGVLGGRQLALLLSSTFDTTAVLETAIQP